MKIGFDAKRAFFNNSGLGNYSRGVIESLSKHYSQQAIHLFSPDGKNKITGGFSANHPIHYFTGPFKDYKRVKSTAKIASSLGIDLFHGLSNEIPSGLSQKRIKGVVTIHDLIFLKLPEYYKKVDRNIYLAKTKYAISNADLIITTSNQTKADIEAHFGAGDRCKTIYQHVSQFNKVPGKPVLTDPYLLYISSFEQRKNHKTLIEAFQKIAHQTNVNLICVGRPKETYSSIKALVDELNLSNRVKLISNASSEELQQYLSECHGFIYPSFYEGFGIPLLEAMQHGVPCACSDIPVFKEIAATDTLFFDPKSAIDISKAIIKLSKHNMDNRQIDTEHLRKFTAESHAKALMNSYLELF